MLRYEWQDMAAAYRWGSALGFAQDAPEGLPASAYPCGLEKIN